MKVDVKRRRGRPSGSTKLPDAYAHLADDPAREATGKVGAVIADAGKTGAEVVAIPRSSALSESWSLEEIRIEDMLLVALRDAMNGLRRNSIDEVDELFDWIKCIDNKDLPPEVARFVDRFKRPRGRMRSRQADIDRFWSDPNRVAAMLAADYAKELRQSGRYKIILSDGSKTTVSAEAVRRAVETINLLPAGFFPRRARAHRGAVMSLFLRRRVTPPRDPLDDDPNPPD